MGEESDASLIQGGRMAINASDFYSLHRPSPCPIQVSLPRKGEKESELGPYDQVIIESGQRDEAAHVGRLGNAVVLAGDYEDQRISRVFAAGTSAQASQPSSCDQ
jgi:hypothetical protein